MNDHPPSHPTAIAAARLGLTGLRAGLAIGLGWLLAACGGSSDTIFVERGLGSGIDFVHTSGAAGDFHFPEIMGGGVGLLDYDGDEDLDALFIDGGRSLPSTAPDGSTPNRLYRNDGDFRFVEVTEAAGLGDGGYGMGVAAADYDNDGDVDLYISHVGPDQLYENRGDGSFVDMTASSGIEAPGFSASAAFCDYDRDGLLDLYVTQYGVWDPSFACTDSDRRPDYCGPSALAPLPDLLWHNEGGGRFVDVSRATGIASKTGHGLGVVCEDLDHDGWLDFYVTNDSDPNFLWSNLGDGTFLDAAPLQGAAVNAAGKAEAGMGLVAADLDQDGWQDLFMTHLAMESNTIYQNLGEGRGFEDISQASGLASSSIAYTGFGTVATDFDLDGDLDLAVANGRVRLGQTALPGTDLPPPWNRLVEPNQLFENEGALRFREVDLEACGFCTELEMSRGLAAGDIDLDGDLDLLLGNIEGPARVYENRASRKGRWLSVRAVDPELGRDVIGARVVLASDGRRLSRSIAPAASYLSSSEARAYFGLGDVESVDGLWIYWPDGSSEQFDVEGLDRRMTVYKGEGEVRP